MGRSTQLLIRRETKTLESETWQEDELLARWLNLGTLRSRVLCLQRRQAENPQDQANHERREHEQDGIGPATYGGYIQNDGSNQQEGPNLATQTHRWEGTVVIFTVLLTVITALQVWTFMASERAVVTVESLVMRLVPDQQLIGKINVRNSGRTTAFITDVKVNVRVSPQLEKIPQYKQKGYVSIRGPLVASGVIRATFKARTDDGTPFMLDATVLAGIIGNAAHLYLYGFINYYTQFRIFPKIFPTLFSHSTGFCAVYIPEGNGGWDYCEEDAYKYGD